MHAFGGGFHRSRTIDEATNDTMKIFEVCKELLAEFYDGRQASKLSISLSKLEDETSMQLSLFEARKWQIRKLGAAIDAMRDKYGPTAVLRAASYTEAGTARERANLIGGHKSGKARLPPED